jgi:hypothetical protein
MDTCSCERFYKQTPLKYYQAVLDPNKPLANMTEAERDQAWVEICEEIQKAVNNPDGFRELPHESAPVQANTEIKNQILERNVNDQLSKSSEGVARVISSVAFILRRFEQVIHEIQGLSIQIKHPDAILLFIWEDDLRILGGKKRRERKRIAYSPSFTTNCEVVWTLKASPTRARVIEGVLWPNEVNPSEAPVTSEAVADQAVSCLLQFVRECVQKSDVPGSYLPPQVL